MSRSLHAGACGFIHKDAAPEQVMSFIKTALGGGIAISDRARDFLVQNVATGKKSSPAQLSSRELEVFTLLGKGVGTRRICSQLGLSIKTIESHRAHIKSKLGIPNAAELVYQASSWVMR